MDVKKLAANLEERQRHHQLSDEAFAKLIGISDEIFRKIKDGQEVSLHTLQQIVDAFGVPITLHPSPKSKHYR